MANSHLMTLKGLSILVLEDEPSLGRRIVSMLERAGADVSLSTTLAAARKTIEDLEFDCALLDINLPDGRSLELLKQKVIPKSTTVLVMTAEVDVANAVEAMRLGAADYLPKPFALEELVLRIARARRTEQSGRREQHHREQTAGQAQPFLFTPTLQPLKDTLERIISADRQLQDGIPAPVLIEGETGTGKTSLARWLHNHGPRAQGPLIEVNCSAIPENLAESELFGHERGAFTDAKEARIGLFEAAEGGSLFLDELPSLSLACQAKLLKAIEDRTIRRVGGHRDLRIDARIIAATNANVRQQVAAGRFREDLLQRLDLFRVRLPPLRERGDDILALASSFATRIAARYRMVPKPITASGQQRLLSYPWPGNVRELAHEIERSLVTGDSDTLEFASLATVDPERTGSAACIQPGFRIPDRGFSLERAIDALIDQALERTKGNVSAAARLLDVSRDYIRYRKKNHDPAAARDPEQD